MSEPSTPSAKRASKPDLNGPHWPSAAPPTEADLAFGEALKAYAFEAALPALRAGADPNRPIPDPWHPGQAFAPYNYLAFGCDAVSRQAKTPESQAKMRDGFLELLLEMERRGADFSAPRFPGSSATTYDAASEIWKHMGGEAAAAFVRAKGDSGTLYSERDFCGILQGLERGSAHGAADFEALWERGGLRERVASLGGRTTILTRLIAESRSEEAQALASLGALPAPLAEVRHGDGRSVGMGPLHALAVEMSQWGSSSSAAEPANAARSHMRASAALACARLAISLGEDPNGLSPQGGTPLQHALMTPKADPAGPIEWARGMAALGARDAPSKKGATLPDFAMRDQANAKALLLLCEEIGSDLSAVTPERAMALMGKTVAPGPAIDRAIRAGLELLRSRGAPLSQPLPPAKGGADLLAAAAARCLPESLALLLGWAGPGAARARQAPLCSWACAVAGSTQVGKDRAKTLALLLSHGADPDARADGEPTALAIAAAGRLRSECQALLLAGADPNALDRAGMSPLRRLYGSRAKAEAPRQQAIGALFSANPRTDWALADPKGALPLELACATAMPDAAVLALAKMAPADALTSAGGARLAAALAKRGASVLAQAERELFERGSAADPKPKAPKPRL